MSQESKFWALFGKFSAVVTTLGAIVAIWVVISQSSEELELEIRSDYYSISPDLETAAQSNLKAFDYPNSKEVVEKILPAETDLNRRTIADSIENVHRESWMGFTKYDLNNYKGVSRLTLSNTGEKTATSIKIDIPSTGIAYVSHPDTGVHILKISGVLAVDDLRAGKVARIVVWTESHLDEYEFKRIDVTHKNGVGSVTWPLEATGLSWFFAEYSFFGPLILWLLFMIGMLAGSSGKSSSRDGQANDTDQLKDN